MSKILNCKKCGLYLGEIDKGKMRNNSVCLCSDCWEKALISMRIAELTAKSGRDYLKDSDKAVEDLMGMFGMRK